MTGFAEKLAKLQGIPFITFAHYGNPLNACQTLCCSHWKADERMVVKSISFSTEDFQKSYCKCEGYKVW